MSIWNRSIAGAVMIAAVVVIRALAIDKLPKKTFPALWGVVLIRLLIPYSVPSPLSVYSFAGRLMGRQEVYASGVFAYTAAAADMPDMRAAERTGGAVTLSEAGASVSSAHPWTVVWLVGFMALTVFFVVSYIRCRREFRESLPVEGDAVRDWLDAHRLRRAISIRYSDRISAPLTFGILRPVILVSKNTLRPGRGGGEVRDKEGTFADIRDIDLVMEHEFVHIRRFDAFTKLALTAALCIHWFNPAVWGMYLLANRDLELSCDEAVIRRFGENTKSAYAHILIRMEEIKSGFSPLCSNFSKNVMEERITAIMKIKKKTYAAAFIAFLLVVGVTALFATSGQTAAASGSGRDEGSVKQDGTTGILTYVDPNTGKAYLSFDDGATYTKANDIMLYTNPGDGISYYSFNEGKTWKPLTDEEDPGCKIEWWTEEEYAVWLEEEKKELQSLLGERAWTASEGWFVWDQERIDRAIAQYERTLQDIRNGWKVSRSFEDGDTAVMFAQDDTDDTLESTSDISFTFEEKTVDLSEFEPFGLTSRNGELFYKGKEVAFFTDRVMLDGHKTFIRYNYWGQAGTVYIRTVRQAVQNADGSTDLFGRLVGIEEYGDDEIGDIIAWE